MHYEGATMNEFDENIKICDKVICDNIKKFDSTERGLLSQVILSNLRNLLEAIHLRIYAKTHDAEIHNYGDIEKANAYVFSRGEYRFLKKFHDFLQASVSHYTPDEENAERLMLKYHEYLIKTKIFSKAKLGLDILENIAKFPTNTDSRLSEYYEKIAWQIDRTSRTAHLPMNRYYVQKCKPFFVNREIYYETTLSLAHDIVSKFDRFIVFSKQEIPSYYAVKLSYIDREIDILEKKMPIKIANEFEVSIRPCEFKNFERIFTPIPKISAGTKEYYNLMRYLTKSGFSLVDIIDMHEQYFQKLRDEICADGKASHIFGLMQKCRELSKNNADGFNIVRYLLLRLHNKTIKDQLDTRTNNWLSYLFLKNESKPFDTMPYATSLSNHNPKIWDLFECISTSGREHELIARRIKDNTEFRGKLYTSIDEFKDEENLSNAIKLYNSKLPTPRHRAIRSIQTFNNYVYINGYEASTIDIVKRLLNMTSTGVQGYKNSVEFWLKNNSIQPADEEKINILKTMFETSKVGLIYGAAGTGKTTLIDHISNFFADQQKLYLANTNPAVENLRRKVKAPNCTFKTIAKVVNSRQSLCCDILFIDECSTVSNEHILQVLEKVQCSLLVLVGDIYQIESITFGNWFHLVKYFIPQNSIYELTNTYRTSDKNLLELWNRVRRIDDKIIEFITAHHYSKTMDDSIFKREVEDEIVLCLNYDGLYGINNINRFLQNSNPNKFFEWGVWRYKVGDPILFNENNRFAPLIYNNLKGWIRGIQLINNRIQFDIEIDLAINAIQIDSSDLVLVENLQNGHSVIRFNVSKYKDVDEDEEMVSDTIVPFQIAYAISIHKAQGLEYESVKVIITNEIEDLISHNIFYTAITRAKKKLKIYWSPETEQKIIAGLKPIFNDKDIHIFKNKTGL